MDNHFFIYPKDKDGKPTGHTICIFNHGGKNYIGEAICSKRDSFKKEVGRKIALERAMIKAVVTTRRQVIDAEKEAENKPDRILISDYREDCDYTRYTGADPKYRSIYRVKKVLQPAFKYDRIKELTIKHAPKDRTVTSAWADLELIRIENDGNGLNVTVRDTETKTRTFRLDYSQAANLKLALKKYDEHYRTGKYTRVK